MLSSPQICMLIAIAAYLSLTIAIGAWFSRKNKTTDDFYLGGRRLGPLVTAMSAEASDMSSWLLMGLPGVAYLSGLADAAWTAIGLAIGTYINWLIVSKRLRNYSASIKGNTIPDFFANRWHDKSKVLLVAAAAVIIIFFVPYTASGFAACGKLFGTLFDMEYHTAMIISAAVIAVYTVLGGFLAASTTDFIQSIVMTIAIVVVLGFGVISVGGFDVVFENAQALPGYLSLTEFRPGGVEAAAYGPLTIISTMAWGLGYFGMPHILLRFMAIRNPKELKTSRRVASVWVVISLAVATLIGIVGYSMTKAGVIGTLADSETIIIDISRVIADNGVIPALIAGIILAGILAATMSTADSQLLAASSSVSQNIVRSVFWKNLSDKGAMLIARGSVLLISVIAVFLAWDPNSSVFQIVSFAWAGFGAAFGPVMLAALFWKRSNRWGAIAGMIAGGAMVFIWKFAIKPIGGVWGIYELLPAFIVACIAIVVVSLLTSAPSKEICDEYDAVKAIKD